MKPLGTSIERFSADFESVTGKRFRHFYCPILHVDEETPLTKGHVVPESLGGSARVLQRRDVDQGFGSFFEAEAADAIRYGLDAKPLDVVLHGDASELKQLGRRFGFQLLLEGADKPLHAWVRNVGDDAVFHVSLEDLKRALGEYDGQELHSGAVGVELDARSSILVTSLRTSHLAWFRLCGYGYVFSDEGRFVASVLRGVYEEFIKPRRGQNQTKKGSLISDRVKREVDRYCLQFANSIRPVPQAALETYSKAMRRGTPDSGRFLALWDGNDIYGKISTIRLGNQHIGVMTPLRYDARGRALVGVRANLELVFSEGWFDADEGEFRIDPPGGRAIWPSANEAAKPLPPLTIRQAAQLVD